MKNFEKKNDLAAAMNRRQITLADGRYMIFYSFDNSLSELPANTKSKLEPPPKPEATEEKNVWTTL